MKYNFCVLLEKKLRVDMYLASIFPDFSRSYIQKMIDRWEVTINGETISKNLKIENRDEVTIELEQKKLEEVLPEKMDFDILYEDENMVVLNKQPGINVHPVPGEGWKENTLVNGMLYHCKDKMPSIGGVERPGIVHRLDKDTSGAIMIAKTDSMMNYLSQTIADRKVGKYYIALVAGKVKNHNFTIESYMGRDPNDRMRMTTLNPVNPKIAITHGEVLEHVDNKYSILKIKIDTGRTHQIRVHLASIGYPILGDKTYGNPKVNKEMATRYQLHRQALHAYQLDLDIYDKAHTFKAPLKEDMKRIISDIVEL